jgi:hypothetical protein
MTPRRFCIRPYDDRGTSLVLALVFITVVSLVVMAVLTFADVSMRTTLALRSQVVENAAAEGAANLAINNLRRGTYGGDGNCFGLNPLSVPSSVFQASLGVVSASVTCEPDTAIGEFPLGTPAQAILTMSTGSLPGLTVTDSNLAIPPVAAGVKASGSVYSNAKVYVGAEANLTAQDGGVVRARTGCDLQSVTIPFVGTFRGTITTNPTTAQCNVATPFTCPQCTSPPIGNLGSQAPQPVPACSAIMSFTPGRYTDGALLNSRTSASGCAASTIFHFTPGIYYFDFAPEVIPVSVPGIGTISINLPRRWRIERGSLIAGALTRAITAGVAPQMPDSCKSPVPTGASNWVPPKPEEGVQFIFSGYSQLELSGAARVEICGAYAGTSAPTAIYALPTPLPPIVGVNCDLTILPCVVLSTQSLNAPPLPPPNTVHIRGTIHTPTRDVNLRIADDATSLQRYNGGVVARRMYINTSRSPGASIPPVLTVPASDPFTIRRTFVRLEVKLCPGQPTCTNGAVRLRAKVEIRDSTGLPVAGPREITILSWNLIH